MDMGRGEARWLVWLALVTLWRVAACTGWSNETDFSSEGLMGGVAPGASACGLMFMDAYNRDGRVRGREGGRSGQGWQTKTRWDEGTERRVESGRKKKRGEWRKRVSMCSQFSPVDNGWLQKYRLVHVRVRNFNTGVKQKQFLNNIREFGELIVTCTPTSCTATIHGTLQKCFLPVTAHKLAPLVIQQISVPTNPHWLSKKCTWPYCIWK